MDINKDRVNLKLIKTIISGKIANFFITERINSKSEIINVWVTATKLVDEAGKIVAVATTERNISDLELAEVL